MTRQIKGMKARWYKRHKHDHDQQSDDWLLQVCLWAKNDAVDQDYNFLNSRPISQMTLILWLKVTPLSHHAMTFTEEENLTTLEWPDAALEQMNLCLVSPRFDREHRLSQLRGWCCRAFTFLCSGLICSASVGSVPGLCSVIRIVVYLVTFVFIP